MIQITNGTEWAATQVSLPVSLVGAIDAAKSRLTGRAASAVEVAATHAGQPTYELEVSLTTYSAAQARANKALVRTVAMDLWSQLATLCNDEQWTALTVGVIADMSGQRIKRVTVRDVSTEALRNYASATRTMAKTGKWATAEIVALIDAMRV